MVPEIKIKDCVIIGGGVSISEGISTGLINYLKDKFVIAINYSFIHFPHTLLTFCDKEFYHSTDLSKHPNVSNLLKQEPLIVGNIKIKEHFELYPNTVIVKQNCSYNKNPLKYGFMWTLTGLFSLQLAELLEPSNIFLLGFDFGELNNRDMNIKESKDDIHYYGKEIKHKGSYSVGFYNRHNPTNYFHYFNKSKSNIYNVSPNSNINDFKKITYTEMYRLLSNETYNQEELRNYIKKLLIN